MTLSPKQIKELVGNRFFEVEFEKADGTTRVMNCRSRVGKYVKGTGKLSDNVVGVWDRAAFRKNLQAGMGRWKAGHASYRCFKPETLHWIKVAGKTYNAEGEEV
jgi:hypothetical protein